MHRGTKIGLAVALAVVMLACDQGGEDGKRKTNVESNRNPADRVVDPAKARRFGIEVVGTGPYELFVHVAREDGKGGSEQTRDKIAGGRYVQTGDYETGAKLRVRVSAKGHPDDQFSCKIVDGLPTPDKFELPSGAAATWAGPDHEKVYCGIVTSG